MPSTCVFEFDRPEPVYYGGETINGRIVLNTTSEKPCREVYIKFKGAAKVHWTERKSRSRNGKTEYYTVHYTGEETYIYTKTQVHGEGALPPGEHVYTFSIPLSMDCPSSCVEQYGEVRYELSLVIDRRFRLDNKFVQPMTILKQINLNMIPELHLPLKDEDIKHFCCFPCSSGPVISTLTIPFGGYAPGQTISYDLEIDNQSAKYDLDGIELEFQQTYKFTATSPNTKSRYHTVTLATKQQNETVLRLSKRILKGDLVIPPVPPSSTNDGIITVYYVVVMNIKTGSCHSDSTINIPITIGTVPLVQSARNPENIAMFMPSAPTPDTPDTPGDLPPSYDSIKPPSYGEATSIKTPFVNPDVDERERNEGFLPRYPMYDNFALPTAPPPADDSVEQDRIDVPLLRSPPGASNGAPATPLLPYPTDDLMPLPALPNTTGNQ